jgi:hypothetical protein
LLRISFASLIVSCSFVFLLHIVPTCHFIPPTYKQVVLSSHHTCSPRPGPCDPFRPLHTPYHSSAEPCNYTLELSLCFPYCRPRVSSLLLVCWYTLSLHIWLRRHILSCGFLTPTYPLVSYRFLSDLPYSSFLSLYSPRSIWNKRTSSSDITCDAPA